MRIADLLFSQGFGSRRDCAALLAAGRVQVQGQTVLDALQDVPVDGLVFSVDGQAWPYHAQAVLMMHKPAGYECSRQPQQHPSVLSLLPPPLQRRGVQPVGRLDQDTTGLLLLTDQGRLIHRLTSPKHHVAKVYEVGTRHPVDAAMPAQLLAGVQLHDDPKPVRAASCEITGPRALRLTLTDGRYHQVKRMVAAAGNRVESLHRSAFGPWTLPDSLLPGHWQWIEAVD